MLPPEKQRLNIAIRMLPEDVSLLREVAFRDGTTPSRYAANVLEAHLNAIRELRVESLHQV